MGRWLTGVVALLAAPSPFAGSASVRDVNVIAAYEPAKSPDGSAAVVVWLEPRRPDIHVNEKPSPRLALSEEQRILVDRQDPLSEKLSPQDPEAASYLDPEQPLRFRVSPAPGAPRGMQLVPAQVTFFYCSTSAGWCRKGTTDVELVVKIE